MNVLAKRMQCHNARLNAGTVDKGVVDVKYMCKCVTDFQSEVHARKEKK